MRANHATGEHQAQMSDLAPVQLEAIIRANGRRGFAYYMEMGLGKTLTG